MGVDAEDGGPGEHGPISSYIAIVEGMLDEVGNGGSGLLVIGGGKDTGTPDEVTDFWNTVEASISESVTYVNGAAAIGSVSFSGFALLVVVSSVGETPSGGLTDAENTALATRQSQIASFVNNGGGLLGLSQKELSVPYGYIAGVGAFVTVVDLQIGEISVTSAGTAIGLTDELDDGGDWHDVYLEFPSFLNVLALHNDDSGADPGDAEFLGEVVALGGANVIIGGDESDERDEDERPRPNVGGVISGVDTAQRNRERANQAGVAAAVSAGATPPVSSVRPPSTGDGGLASP